ncbi:hypothetical protein BET01_16845 [Lacrimispora algidixylanolytica]|uniref:FAD/NAD(P)-binding domain-containing protein n=1 Tax=Lacrimispora algidixylanolytica TaxID=94868 RepID=A0A419T5T7_9FIRM|nr:hypothetical protein BET01_16845 [Lacrimispora algidixylanolytica]
MAVDVARSAIRAGSSSVFMYCLEDRLMMPASKEEVDEALEEGIEIHNSWGPCEIQSEDGNVKRVILKKCVSVTDSEGHFQPQYDENERMTVECESVIVSIGQSIIWGDLLLGSKVQLARGDRAAAHSLTYQTEQPDVFVGGDVFTGPRFAIDAISLFRELPEASRMVKSEDKMKMVLPYALKRQIKIMRNKNRSV